MILGHLGGTLAEGGQCLGGLVDQPSTSHSREPTFHSQPPTSDDPVLHPKGKRKEKEKRKKVISRTNHLQAPRLSTLIAHRPQALAPTFGHRQKPKPDKRTGVGRTFWPAARTSDWRRLRLVPRRGQQTKAGLPRSEIQSAREWIAGLGRVRAPNSGRRSQDSDSGFWGPGAWGPLWAERGNPTQSSQVILASVSRRYSSALLSVCTGSVVLSCLF